MSVAPFDNALSSAKLPITVEYLADVEGEIYIGKTDDLAWLDSIGMEFVLGGLKSKGFGTCKICSKTEVEPKIIEKESRFLSRIYFDDNVMEKFGMNKANIVKPYFGYLFKKTSQFSGYYQKALFEQSTIRNAYDFLETIKEVLAFVASEVEHNRIMPDWKGDYFSGGQLDDLRKVLEKNGFETAKIFLYGKIKPKGSQMEFKKIKIILGLLERLSCAESLDMHTKSYIIGKLNPIYTVYKEEGR